MLYIDLKYVRLLAPKLSNFKQVDTHAYRFRCPICGDSKKSQTKSRGNIFPSKGKLHYKCFNCHTPIGYLGLIKQVDPNLYKEYLLEKYKNPSIKEEYLFKKEEPIELLKDSILDDLIEINDLRKDHPVIEIIEHRKIPKDKWNRIYYTKKFKTWVNSILPDKFNVARDDNPRLVFPYFNKHGKVFAANSRAFGDEEPKYIITKFDNSYETVYGLDTVDWGRHVFVVEGQIDSLFLPNCLAVSGSSFDIDTIRKIKSNCTLIFDNEPRNKQIVKIISNCIDKGYNICLFPRTFEFKDINEAIIGGLTVDQIVSIIRKNTFSGIKAKLIFSDWRT
jgi:hypothetical protein